MTMTRLGIGLLFIAALGSGCILPTNQHSRNASDRQGLTLTWDLQDGSRTLLPATYPVPTIFDVELVATGQTTIAKKGLTEKRWNLGNIPAALWTVTVKGYERLGSSPIVVGGGTVDLTKENAQSLAVILYYQGTGTGRYHVKVSSNATLGEGATLNVVLTSPSGTTTKTQAQFLNGQHELASETASAGSYRLFLKLKSDSKAATKMVSVVVFQGVDTQGTLTFVESDFSEEFVPVASLELPTSLTLGLNEVSYPEVTVFPANASFKDVSWQSSDPSVVSVDSLTGRLEALVFGTATITATSGDGEVSGSFLVSVVPDNSDEAIQHAKDLFKAKKYTEALAAFEKSDSGEAVAYLSLLRLASLGVNPDVVYAGRTLLGLKDYPDTMEALFSSGWFHGEFFQRNWQEEYYPSIKLPGSQTHLESYYADYYEYLRVVAPALDIPSEVHELISGSDSEVAPGTLMEEYLMTLVFNALTKDPQGLNALLDRLDTGVFGPGWDKILASISALPEDVVITLDYQETPGLPSWIPFQGAEIPPVVIGKAELLAEAATLDLLRGTFQWLKAQNLAFPVLSVVHAMDLKTGRLKAVPSGDNPIETNFLSLRDPASLIRSQASFVAGLEKLKQSIDLVNLRDSSAPFDVTPDQMGWEPGVLSNLSGVLEQARQGFASGGTLFVPTDPGVLMSGDVDLATDGTGKTRVEVGALFSQQDPFLQLNRLVALNSVNTAPRWFVDTSDYHYQMVEVGPGLTTPISGTNALFIQVHPGVIVSKLLPGWELPPSLESGYLPVSFLAQGDKMMAWFGQTWVPPVEVTVGGY